MQPARDRGGFGTISRRRQQERRSNSRARRRSRSSGVGFRQPRLFLPGQRVFPLHALRLQLYSQPMRRGLF